MDDEFKDKTLKLLADPRKLKEIKRSFVTYDHFKNQLEYKFNCSIEQPLYDKLVAMIHKELIISSIMDTIIYKIVNE
jgi:hypothetical protein|tara:strand:- start:130 stop:360 length:231 start_codon:yes stop_codon:yes gene_type:complete